MSHLRQIALTVDEAEPGQFYWVLLESVEDGRLYDSAIRAAEESAGTYMEALEAGYQEMRRMVNWREGMRK